MALADRLDRLGTETAFAVSLAAADWAAKGNRVYPFHLGDLNLPTPPNVVDALDRAIAAGKTGYCPAAGIPELRDALAEDVGDRRGMTYDPSNVVVQPGGKPVITKFVQAVMNPGDEVLYPNPGYPIYESQIEYFGGTARPYRYLPDESGFRIDLDQLRSLVRPSTRAIIYNDLHNPIGAESTDEEREAVAELARRHDLWVLSDEAYFEMRYSGSSRSIASLPGMRERTVILYTFSKKFAMTGWRLGAAIGPAEVAETIAKLNTNDESCTTHFVQHAGVEALRGEQSATVAVLDVLRERRDACVDILSSTDGVSVHRPEATFYLFPDVTEAMAAKGIDDVSRFAEAALRETGVSFCTRRHFGRPQPGEDRQYVRFAYSGIDTADIVEGLGRLRSWLGAS
jgi:aspartate/methionine/tyrosine aminotransferase